MIVPTVGRVVLFFPGEGAGFSGTHPEAGEAIPALVCKVWSDRLINIGGFDADGRNFSKTSVRLVQEGDLTIEGESYATWMPYQIAAAAKEAPHGLLQEVKEFFAPAGGASEAVAVGKVEAEVGNSTDLKQL